MTDIPLATNDKGEVLGLVGNEWKPPDDVAQNQNGVKAYRFGGDWQVEPEKNVAANRAAYAASSLGSGIESGMNPLNWVGSAASVAGNRYVQAVLNPPSIAANFFGPEKPSNPVADWAFRNAPATSPMRLAGPAAQGILSAMGRPTSDQAIQEAIQPEKVAEKTGAQISPEWKSVGKGLEIAGSILPTMGMGGPAATLKTAALSGTGGAVGDYLGGDTGRMIGALAGPFVPGAIARLTASRAVPPAPAVPTEREASEKLAQTLADTYSSEKGLVTPEIQAAKQTIASAKMPTNVVKGYSDKYLANVGPVEASTIPTATLEKALTGKVVDFKEVDNALSIMKAQAREMPPLDPRRVAVERYVAHMSDLAPYKQQGVQGAYSQYAQFKREFNNPQYKNLFRLNPDRSPKIAPSEVGDYLKRLPQEAVESLAQYPNVRQAMADYSRSRGVDIIEKTLADAKLSAPKFSASGYENSIRSAFRTLSKNEGLMQSFTDAERAAIEGVAKGGPVSNLLRFVGRAAPVGALNQMAHVAGVVAHPAIGLPFSAITSAARLGARSMQSNRANAVLDLVRRGGPAPLPALPALLTDQRMRAAAQAMLAAGLHP